MPEFFCFYERDYDKKASEVIPVITRRDYYPEPLPNYVCCDRAVIKLLHDKPLFWGTFNQSEMNGESFYY